MFNQLYHQVGYPNSLPWPQRPLCSQDLSRGLWRAPLAEALQLPYIQANPHKLIWVLVFDVDRPAALFSWQDANLPPPTWITTNPKNGHAHIAYVLSAPVAKSDVARLKPLRLLARIQHAITEKLEADKGYTGLITKTPMHGNWHTWLVRHEPYDLNELRDWLPDDLPLPKRIKRAEAAGLGRNVALFDTLRFWSYRNRRHFKSAKAWHKAVLSHAEQINDFQEPLPFSEIKSTAKSVAKWTWAKFDINASNARFSKLQAHRARIGVTAKQSANIDLQGELLK